MVEYMKVKEHIRNLLERKGYTRSKQKEKRRKREIKEK
jgi:hypothetical protein